MFDYEREIADELAALRKTDAAICQAVDMARVFEQFPSIRIQKVGKLVKVGLPGEKDWEEWVYNPRDGLFRNAQGDEIDKIDFYAKLTGLPRNEAALALASDPTVQREQTDTNEAPPPLPPAFTFEDLDLILPDIDWLWEPWLPVGAVTLLVGKPGSGKSALALAIAGIVTTGEPWPDSQENNELGRVVWVETESAQAIQRQRATAWGLPKARLIIPAKSDPLEKVWLDEEEGWQIIEREARRDGVKLLVLDSLRGAYKGDENTSDTLDLLNRLAALARDTQIAVLVVHHLRKRGMLDDNKINLDRVRGSSAIVQIPRCVWAIDRPDPLTPDVIRLSQIKNNLARFPEPIGFEISETGITWREAPTEPEAPTQREQAADLLLTLLKDGPRLATELYEEAEQAGISKITLKRAKKALGVVAVRKEGHWWWALPARKI